MKTAGKTLRTAAAYICAPYIAATGNGFGRHHRNNETLVYRLIDTVAANQIALAINPNADRRAA